MATLTHRQRLKLRLLVFASNLRPGGVVFFLVLSILASIVLVIGASR